MWGLGSHINKSCLYPTKGNIQASQSRYTCGMTKLCPERSCDCIVGNGLDRPQMDSRYGRQVAAAVVTV